MDRLLKLVLARLVRSGTLRVTTSSGRTFTVGDGTGKPIEVRFKTPTAQRQICFDPELRLGEAYMDGSFAVERGDSIADLLGLVFSQTHPPAPRWARPRWLGRYLRRRLMQLNRRSRAQRNVAHHYDLDGRLYSLFLDADQQYSCGYFEAPSQSLDDAQLAKKRHLAAKLLVRPGSRVLDIGSGWGGLALYLAEVCGARVDGVTLSREQLQRSRARAEEKGLAARVAFHLEDYRDLRGRFDRIVSVGMFEHVGVGFYDAFFRKCAQLVADDGVILLHSIARSDGPGYTNPWIARYIFPGGYIPALSEVLPAIERAGLLVCDVEILRLHYAETLRAWRGRFMANWDKAAKIEGERFCRMWEFYLAGSETSFRVDGHMVFQIQLARRQTAVPLTRDYIAEREEALRSKEAEQPVLREAAE